MTKKDYIRAAEIAQNFDRPLERSAVIAAFVLLFKPDNGNFDESRFIAACRPGANARSRRP